jgi:transcriptional antiterminator NusG
METKLEPETSQITAETSKIPETPEKSETPETLEPETIPEEAETTEVIVEAEVSNALDASAEPSEPSEPEPETEEEQSKDIQNEDKTDDSPFFRIDTDDSESSDDSQTDQLDVMEGKPEAQDIEAAEKIEDLESKSNKGSFLELDTETRERMIMIEEEEQRAAEQRRIEEEEAEFMETGIFAIKTSIGHEKMVANWIALRARKRKLSVFAILSPPKLRGYLLLEGVKNKEALQDLIKGVQHARSVVDGMSSLEEIEHFLTPKPLVSGIEEGDVVEIIAGPFKGEKAKVTQIDEGKEEITVELFEAMVSIPVTIRGDHVRILEKEGK